MNRDEMLQLWQRARRRPELSQGFSDRVMSRVFEYERRKSKTAFSLRRLIEIISSRPAATAAAIALGAAAGVARDAIVVLSFLAF